MDLRKALIKNYSIDKITDIGKFIQGFSNEHAIITTEHNKYFLKRFAEKFNDKIGYYLDTTAFFYSKGIPAMLPIETKNGSLCFIWKNRYYSLYPHISNLKIIQNNLSNTALLSAGQMLAKIHLAGKNYSHGEKKQFRHWDKIKFNERYTKIMSIIEKKPRKDKTDRLFLEKLAIKHDFVNKNKLYFKDSGLKCDHLIHGDYHQRNIAFDKRGQLKYVFDFKSKLSSRILEFIRSMDLICLEDYTNVNYCAAKKFLAGYNSVYPINKEELKKGLVAHHIKNFYQLWSEEEYYLNNNKSVKFLLESSIQRLKYSSKNLNVLVDKLSK